MSIKLGLDQGSSSIGWALINTQTNKILGTGVRIFPEGVANFGQGIKEISNNASRTAKRGSRRQRFRKKLSKKMLLELLSKNNMCPLTEQEIKEWKTTKKFPESQLKEWFALNPYTLRNKALTEEITLMELGRIFYQIMQRRGFLSNSRSASSKEDGAIFTGDDKKGKIGITQTINSITQARTLGSYLNSIMPVENEPYVFRTERIRNRYTTRQMYIDEFDAIWSSQERFHPNLDHSLMEAIGGRKSEEEFQNNGILFDQRPLKSQKHLIGTCTFETDKPRTQLSTIDFEQFRAWQWVNTVDCNGNELSPVDKQTIIDLLYTVEKIDFSKIRKAIGKDSSSYNFNYKDDDKVVGTYTISNLSHKKFFGNKWFQMTEKQQDDVWQVLDFFDSKSHLKKYAKDKWNFTDKQADDIVKFNLKDGYSSLSRKAIGNILPFLKMGYMYDIAAVLGGIKNAFGSKWDALPASDKDYILDNVPSIVRSKSKGGFIGHIKEMLIKDFNMSYRQLRKLYHHSMNIHKTQLLDKLPVDSNADKEIQGLKNPVVSTALFETRKLINALIDEYGTIDEIVIEMSRDLKQNKSERSKTRSQNKFNESKNDKIKKKLAEEGVPTTYANIEKFKLWEECKGTCPYTGNPIPYNILFNGPIEVEHIHPWSKSLNNSFANKTLAYADANRAKSNMTPFEYYSNDTVRWNEMKARVLELFKFTKEYPNSYSKFKRFVQENYDDDFVSRQLNDTRFICTETKSYLSKICSNITVSTGQATALLRRNWGLNDVLNEDNMIKSRENHKHHAVDALVIACTTASHIQRLSQGNCYYRKQDLLNYPTPWGTFRKDAEDAINNILVSHKKTNKSISKRKNTVVKKGVTYTNTGIAARGQLHEETFYGKRLVNGEPVFHFRKNIEDLTELVQIEKIVDKNIKEIIHQRIKFLGGMVHKTVKGKTGLFIPDNLYFETINGVKTPMIYLPNKNGEPVPVLRVRIEVKYSNLVQKSDNTNCWINPGNNHHAVIYTNEKGKPLNETISLYEVVKRKMNNESTYQIPKDGKELLLTIEKGDIFLVDVDESEIDWNDLNYNSLVDNLYKNTIISHNNYKFRHITCSKSKNPDFIGIRNSTDCAKRLLKVNISVTGKITKALK